MSSLVLVRHAQASFFADDYDRLSELGRRQASLLAEYWTRRGVVFDEVYTGPRTRQRETAELACRAASATEPVSLAELDEYDLGGLLHRLAPAVVHRDSGFADLVTRYRESEGEHARATNFQRMFEVLVAHWQAGVCAGTDLEPWSAFRDRVRRGLSCITDRPGRGRRVVAFSSGGFIGTAVQLALAAPDRSALELSWRIRNCAVTEFVFTQGRLTLDSFNMVPHLEDSALWTYR